ncbi:hypothetical protein [Pseudomonas sp. WAC2]
MRDISCAFDQRQYTCSALAVSLASCTARAAERLRAQQLLCQILSRPACMAPPEHRYSKRAILNLPYSIDDTRVLIQYALHGLKHIYQDGLCLRQV